MKAIITLAGAAAMAASMFAVPQFAAAQAYRDYGNSDPCAEQQRSAANKGTAVGAVLGAVLGSQVAGHGAKTEGSIVGAGLGAVAGHQIAKHNFKCVAAPRRVAARNDCRWVQEYSNGRNHDFEVCRGRDGVWHPSGRS